MSRAASNNGAPRLPEGWRPADPPGRGGRRENAPELPEGWTPADPAEIGAGRDTPPSLPEGWDSAERPAAQPQPAQPAQQPAAPTPQQPQQAPVRVESPTGVGKWERKGPASAPVHPGAFTGGTMGGMPGAAMSPGLGQAQPAQPEQQPAPVQPDPTEQISQRFIDQRWERLRQAGVPLPEAPPPEEKRPVPLEGDELYYGDQLIATLGKLREAEDPQQAEALRRQAARFGEALGPEKTAQIAANIGQAVRPTLQEPREGPSGLAGFARSFQQGVAPWIASEVTGPDVAAWAERLGRQRPGTGAGGFLGKAAGAVAPTGGLMAANLPVGLATIGSKVFSDTYEETGNPVTATGAAVVELGTELLGFKIAEPLARAGLDAIGRAVREGNAREAVKILGNYVAQSNLEGAEEAVATIGQEVNRAATGEQSFGEAGERIAANIGESYALGAVGGGMIEAPAMVGRAALRGRRTEQDQPGAEVAPETQTPQRQEARDAEGRGLRGPETDEGPLPQPQRGREVEEGGRAQREQRGQEVPQPRRQAEEVLTEPDRAALRGLGWTDQDIQQMAPGSARALIDRQVEKRPETEGEAESDPLTQRLREAGRTEADIAAMGPEEVRAALQPGRMEAPPREEAADERGETGRRPAPEGRADAGPGRRAAEQADLAAIAEATQKARSSERQAAPRPNVRPVPEGGERAESEQRLTEFGRKLGVDVQFVESDDALPFSGMASRRIPGRVYIDRKAGDDAQIASVFAHEWTHSLKNTNPEEWETLAAELEREAPDFFRESLERYQTALEAEGATGQAFDPREEAVAATAEDVATRALTQHPSEIAEQARQRPSLWKRILRGMARTLRRIGVMPERMRRVEQSVDQIEDTAETARAARAVQRAMRSAYARTEPAPELEPPEVPGQMRPVSEIEQARRQQRAVQQEAEAVLPDVREQRGSEEGREEVPAEEAGQADVEAREEEVGTAVAEPEAEAEPAAGDLPTPELQEEAAPAERPSVPSRPGVTAQVGTRRWAEQTLRSETDRRPESVPEIDAIADELDTPLSASPDALSNREKLRYRQAGIQLDEEAAQAWRERLGERRYEQAIDEKMKGRAGRVRDVAQEALEAPDRFPADTVLASFVREQWGSEPQRERTRESVDPETLAAGQTFESFGVPFEVGMAEGGKVIRRTDGEREMELPVDELPSVPVDQGTLGEAPEPPFAARRRRGVESSEEATDAGQAEQPDAGRERQREAVGRRGDQAARQGGPRQGRADRSVAEQVRGPADLDPEQRAKPVTAPTARQYYFDQGAEFYADKPGGPFRVRYPNGLQFDIEVRVPQATSGFAASLVAHYGGRTDPNTGIVIPSTREAFEALPDAQKQQLKKSYATAAYYDRDAKRVLLHPDYASMGGLDEETYHAITMEAMTLRERILMTWPLWPRQTLNEETFGEDLREAEESAYQFMIGAKPAPAGITDESLRIMEALRNGDPTRAELPGEGTADQFAPERFAVRRGRRETGRARTPQTGLFGDPATAGGTGSLFEGVTDAERQEARQRANEQIDERLKLPEAAETANIGLNDAMKAAPFMPDGLTGNDKLAFIEGVRQYNAGRKRIRVPDTLPENADKDQYRRLIRRGYNKAKEGASEAMKADVQMRQHQVVERAAETGELFDVPHEGVNFAVRRTPGGDGVMTRRDFAPPFFSQLQATVESFPRPNSRMTPKQLRGWLRKQPGVKPEEMRWTGFDEWLDSRERVTAQEAAEYLRENAVRVEEVVKAESFTTPEENRREGILRARPYSELTDAEKAELSDIERRQAIREKPKFETYKLPGGQNYQELLLTKPRESRAERLEDLQAQEHDARQRGDEAEADRINQEAQRVAEGETIGGMEFRSSHFDEPNILAHVRFDERVTEDGFKTLFIEEVQSDWATEARKRGVQGEEDVSMDFDESAGEWVVSRGGEELARSADRAEARRQAGVTTGETAGGVPDAPFIRGTGWLELTLKRMARWAADNDFDAISWTPGQMQADRYGEAIQKQVNSIEWSRGASGAKNVTMAFSGRMVPGGAEMAVNDNGVVENATLADLEGKPLEDVVGKDMARQIIEQDSGELAGTDIRIGGEWAYNLYDRMIPQFYQKFGKKWGARTGDVQIPVEDRTETAHAMTVPAKMREDVTQRGVPLFAVRRQRYIGGNDPEQFRLFDGFTIPSENATRAMIRVWQDSLRPLKTAERAIEEQGGRIAERSDPYLLEELRRGRTKNRLRAAERRYVRPIVQAARSAGLSQRQVDQYLYARHAPERNERIQSINPDFQPGGRYEGSPGSGMSTDSARQIERAAEEGRSWSWDPESDTVVVEGDQSPKRGQGFRRVARLFDRMNKETRESWVRDGLETREYVDRLEQMYDAYAPLRSDVEEGVIPGVKMGRGLSIRGREAQHAFGRISAADSPLAFAFTQMESAVIRGEKNRVGQAFLRLVRDNPDPAVWQVNKRATKYVLDRDGMVKEVYDRSHESQPNVVSVKENGEKVTVTLDPAHQQIAEAMTNLGAESVGAVTQAVGRVSRTIAGLATRWNPVFPPVNLIRDVGTGSINLAGERGGKMALATVRDVPRAARALQRLGRERQARAGSEWDRFAREYREDGAPISYLDLNGVTEFTSRISAEIRGINPTAPRAAWRALRSVGSYIETVNDSMENAMRLSAYVHARKDLGMSRRKAASMAKNLTTNFERRGTRGSAMNAWYMFSNAGIQGTARLLQATSHRGVQAIVGAVVLEGFILDMVNYMLAGEDDDGENHYEKMPDWQKTRHLVVMDPTGSGNRLMVPLPYGYNVFHATGTKLSQIARNTWGMGRQSNTEAMAAVVDSALESFNPMGGGGSLLQHLTPTVLDPLAQIGENKDWAGRRIYPDQPAFEPEKPLSQLYFPSVSKPSKALTAWLNRVTGGTKYEPGVVDVSPEMIDHMLGFGFSGAGTTAGRAEDLIEKWGRGDRVRVGDIPLLRRFASEPSPYHARSRFYEYRNEVNLTSKMLRDAREAGEWDEWDRIYRERGHHVYELEPMLKNAQQRLKTLRSRRAAAEEKGDHERRREIEDEIQTIYEDFNRFAIQAERR